jgi:hypothetical protein
MLAEKADCGIALSLHATPAPIAMHALQLALFEHIHRSPASEK